MPTREAKTEQARKIFRRVCNTVTIDRALFTDNANSYFNEQALRDFADSLAPLRNSARILQMSQVPAWWHDAARLQEFDSVKAGAAGLDLRNARRETRAVPDRGGLRDSHSAYQQFSDRKTCRSPLVMTRFAVLLRDHVRKIDPDKLLP